MLWSMEGAQECWGREVVILNEAVTEQLTCDKDLEEVTEFWGCLGKRILISKHSKCKGSGVRARLTCWRNNKCD